LITRARLLHPRSGEAAKTWRGQLQPVGAAGKVELVEFRGAELLEAAESGANELCVQLLGREEQPEWFPGFGNAPRQSAEGHAMDEVQRMRRNAVVEADG
jgi:hypothetical protein